MPFWSKDNTGRITPQDDNKNLGDIEFKPENFKKELDAELDKRFETFQTKQKETLNPLLEMAEASKKDREEAEARRVAAENKKKTEEETPTDDDFLIDPQGAIAKSLKPAHTAIAQLAAQNVRRDVLDNKEYYTGAIKSKVDAMLAAQPLAQQIRPDVVENCYKVVCFDHQEAITKGEIKSRNNAASFESTGTGAPAGGSKKDETELTPDQKRAASIFGINETEWKKSMSELEYA